MEFGEIAYRSVHLVSSHGYEPSRAVRLSEGRGDGSLTHLLAGALPYYTVELSTVFQYTVPRTSTPGKLPVIDCWLATGRKITSAGSYKSLCMPHTPFTNPSKCTCQLVNSGVSKGRSVPSSRRPWPMGSGQWAVRSNGKVARARNQKSTNRAHS
jgi:hypothetical protein